MRNLKIAALAFLLLFSLSDLWAFCGFYVAKADANLFNEKSQVIIVRDGTQTVVTMSSDFKGDVKDFAMVVPVPEVLSKDQVKTVTTGIFTKSDAYSSPRIVEYQDQRICPIPYAQRSKVPDLYNMETLEDDMAPMEMAMDEEEEYHVTVVEKFSVDEYDVVILSAEESDGLERWLIDNGYKIPEGAKEVLEPYIKSEMKFFVVKVNLDKLGNSPTKTLNPIQITYNTNNFMLPIRLGMANAKGDQDMLVYTFTRKGRVETTNYRTTQVPTDKDIPFFVQNRFGEFYKDAFAKSWKKQGKNTVWLEYAWDISASNPVKCDPCNAALFTYQELMDAGVFWVENGGYGQYKGDLFMTRLHVRYNRSTFPQDLGFQITPNQENFQARYVTHRVAPGPYTCDEIVPYFKDLKKRRQKEVKELASLTGWKTGQFYSYIHEYDSYLPKQVEKNPIDYQPTGTGKVEKTDKTDEITSLVKTDFVKDPQGNPTAKMTVNSTESDSFVPEVIEKSADPEYMTAKAESTSRKDWWIVPMILLGIFAVLGISRKKKKMS